MNLALDILKQDLRYAARMIRRTPAVTSIAVMTLALGLGANAAVYSVAYRLVAQPTPGIKDDNDIKRLHQHFTVALTKEQRTRDTFSFPEVAALRRALSDQTTIVAYSTDEIAITEVSPRKVRITNVVGDYFGVLGIQPLLGRFFSVDEVKGNSGTPVVVLSGHTWSAVFGRQQDVIGRQVTLGNRRFTVIGVAPDAFRGVALVGADMWVPLDASRFTDSAQNPARAYDLRFNVLSRTAFNRTTQSALVATQTLQELNIIRDSDATVSFVPLARVLDPRRTSAALAMIARLGAASFVLSLVAWVNVAGLLLMRSTRRQHEFAVRAALGVSRYRLLLHVITESTLLAALAVPAALLAAKFSATILQALLVPELETRWTGLGLRVAAITTVGALLIGAVVGVAPALHLIKAYIGHGSVRPTDVGGPTRSLMRSSIILVQVCSCVLLLMVAALFVRSFRHLQHASIGYDGQDVIWAEITGTEDNRIDEQVASYLNDVRQRIAAMQGVQNVAVAASLPMRTLLSTRLFLPDRDSVPTLGHSMTGMTSASPEFLATLQIPLVAGRGLTDTDRLGAAPVVLVSALMAERFWPGESAINKCLIVGSRTEPCRRVVGVVADVRSMNILERPTLRFYLPIAQATGMASRARVLLVRTAEGQAQALYPTIRQILESGVPSSWKLDMGRFTDILAPELRPWRISAMLLSALGAMAIVIAGIGIYGAVASAAAQRVKEFGIRRALGADHLHIVWLVVREGVRPVAYGLLLGSSLVIALGDLVSLSLYSVSQRDPTILAGVSAIVMSATLIACVFPVISSLRDEPAQALLIDSQ